MTLNGYILGEGYKRPHMLEFWGTESIQRNQAIFERSIPSTQANQKEEKRKKAPSLPKIQKSFLYINKAPLQRSLKCPRHTNQSKESPSNQSSSSEISSKRRHLNSFFYIHLNICICANLVISAHS